MLFSSMNNYNSKTSPPFSVFENGGGGRGWGMGGWRWRGWSVSRIGKRGLGGNWERYFRQGRLGGLFYHRRGTGNQQDQQEEGKK